MPITADLGGKKYVLGRGKAFFDRFASGVNVIGTTLGEGERYLGNTPEFLTNSESEDLDHFDSDGGVRVKDASVQLTLDRGGSFTCDNIDRENVALYFLGDATGVSQAAATGLTFTIVAAKRGRFYQLGFSESLPQGHRKVTGTPTVGKGVAFGTNVVAAGNWQIDEDTGRIYVLETAPDINSVDIQVTYDIAAVTYDRIVSKSNAIYGALRFIADNPKGANTDYYLPYVKLSPDGDYNLKGDDWQTMGFTMEILKKSSIMEAMYATTRPVAV